MKTFQLEHITSSYGRKRVLTDASVNGEAGQCIGLIGRNGSGKTTLLDIMAGMRKPDSGRIYFMGEEVNSGKRQRQNFLKYTGYVPQEHMLVPELTVWDNLLLWYGDKRMLMTELETGVLAMLELQSMLKTPVHKLSGGMLKRVSIGCAMAGNPPVLILDEPGAALDMPGHHEILTYLQEYKQQGRTIMLATHDEQELKLCDKIYILEDGQCMERGENYGNE